MADAKDLLCELITATMRVGQDPPKPLRPSEQRTLVVPPVLVAVKADSYEMSRKADMPHRHLDRDLDIN